MDEKNDPGKEHGIDQQVAQRTEYNIGSIDRGIEQFELPEIEREGKEITDGTQYNDTSRQYQYAPPKTLHRPGCIGKQVQEQQHRDGGQYPEPHRGHIILGNNTVGLFDDVEQGFSMKRFYLRANGVQGDVVVAFNIPAHGKTVAQVGIRDEEIPFNRYQRNGYPAPILLLTPGVKAVRQFGKAGGFGRCEYFPGWQYGL